MKMTCLAILFTLGAMLPMTQALGSIRFPSHTGDSIRGMAVVGARPTPALVIDAALRGTNLQRIGKNSIWLVTSSIAMIFAISSKSRIA